jgi:type IV pilus assembly protein PilA
MLIKMKESKGFTLVELMIVVAIIGILAAVAVPFYQRYIQKSRLTSMVFPGLHAIQTNVGNYYSFRQILPAAASIVDFSSDADTGCFTPSFAGIGSGGETGLRIIINGSSQPTRCKALAALDGMTLDAVPNVTGSKIVSWALSGGLASRLGLAGEGS